MFRIKLIIFFYWILFFSDCSLMIRRSFSSNDPKVMLIENRAGSEYYRLECASRIAGNCPRITIEPIQLPIEYLNVEKPEDLIEQLEMALSSPMYKNIRIERMVLEGNEVTIFHYILKRNALKNVMFQKGMTAIFISFSARKEVYKDYESVFDRFWKRYMKLEYE